MAHAIAPGATILVVEAQSQSRRSMLRAVNTARNTPGVVAISMSWGFNEFANEASYNSYFTTPAGHRGITFVAASGDSGPQGGAEWPSVSPNVLAVGGTTFYVDPSGNYQFETAWIGSSGGYSRYEAEPGYQRSVQATGRRSTPDVAFDGDPDTGVAVYETSDSTGQGSWETVGGTSLGTPAWAAIIAIVDQGRTCRARGAWTARPRPCPTLYALPSTDFNVIAPLPHFAGAVAGSVPTRRLAVGRPSARRSSPTWSRAPRRLRSRRAGSGQRTCKPRVPRKRSRTRDSSRDGHPDSGTAHLRERSSPDSPADRATVA